MTCEWKTNQVSAREGIDYTTGIGRLTFAPGVNSTTLNIPILDNNIPEIEKVFRVQLYNPTGGGTCYYYYYYYYKGV